MITAIARTMGHQRLVPNTTNSAKTTPTNPPNGTTFATSRTEGGLFTGANNIGQQSPNAFTAIMGEAGFRFDAVPISPIVKFEHLSSALTVMGTNIDISQNRFGGGLAYWPFGHNINVKGFFPHSSTKAEGGDSVGQDQFQLQTQLYFF